MPRRKNWKWAEKKRTEWRERSRTAGIDTTDRERSRTDDGERTVKCDRPHGGGRESPSNVVAGHKCKIQAKNLAQIQAKNLAQNQAKEQAKTGKHTNFSQFKQAVNEVSTLIKNVSSNIQTDFETEFLNVFPDVDGDQSSGINESSERENIVFNLQNTMPQLQTQLNKNVIAQQQKFNHDSFDTCSEDDDMVVRISEQLWNASNLLFGSFHQNDVRFSERSRGYQCTCNALCMLSYATCMDTEKSFILDKVLCEGDTLYESVIEKLKSEGKFIHCLLSLEEIPDDFKIEIGKFMTEKLPIKSGLLVDTEGLGLPTLHEVFFDSHSHGKNGLTSSDGASCLITFSSFDDLVRYMYAFYDSLKLDSNIQFDFLPLKVHKTEETQRLNDQMSSNLEAYFIIKD